MHPRQPAYTEGSTAFFMSERGGRKEVNIIVSNCRNFKENMKKKITDRSLVQFNFISPEKMSKRHTKVAYLKEKRKKYINKIIRL